MLNRDLVASAKKKLSDAVDLHGNYINEVTKLSVTLYELRRSSSTGLIVDLENFVNSMANTPKEFEKAFEKYHIELNIFDNVVDEINRAHTSATVKGSAASGVGIAAGAATALMGPTAAMAVATTFGTASTGTAIASLSGAAATKAALAWLGGGALAAGGGGMGAGGALLGLAGPVGWGLAALAATGGVAYMAYSNANTAEEADKKRIPVEAEIRAMKIAKKEINETLKLTHQHVDGMYSLFNALKQNAPASYKEMSQSQKDMLRALVNHVHSLAHLLTHKVSDGSTAKGS